MSAVMEQRDDSWFAARCGKITASRMHDVMAVAKKDGRPLKARSDYARQLAAEHITGKPREQIKAVALQWGQDVEPAARAAYQAKRGVIVQQAGFIEHPMFPFVGASPDFLVGHDGGGEIKSPFNTEVHLTTLLEGLPEEHIEQIQGGLWVTGRSHWDFVSFHPDFPPATRCYIQRVERDDAYIAKLERVCLELEAEVRAIVQKLAG